MNERISFDKNPLPLVLIKDSFKIYFHEMEILFPVDRILKKFEQKGFH